MKASRLFVGNLAFQTMEDDLQEYFSQAGVVTSVQVMLNKIAGRFFEPNYNLTLKEANSSLAVKLIYG